ncbi:MAG: hypothetical protein Q7K65_05145 [Candidatus Buchananbacteria bacterium]|nr:hypothetical protein [Candidatus Buchananbacteria bacterium]
MPESPEKMELKPDLLEKINQALKELGSTLKYKRAPEFKKEYESLAGKTIVMVDDIVDVIEAIMPDLMVATDGHADFVKYDQQDINQLIEQIIAKNPDIVLLDYHLSNQLKGSAIAGSLKGQGFEGDIVGFSSDSGAKKDFEKAGITACVEKEAYNPSATISSVGKIFSEEKE